MEKQALKSELSQYSNEELELIASSHFNFNDECPMEIRIQIRNNQIVAQEILEGRGRAPS